MLLLLACLDLIIQNEGSNFKTCYHIKPDVEGNKIPYSCSADEVCCSTVERPVDCCPHQEDVNIKLSTLLLYLLAGIILLLILVLTVFCIYKLITRRSRTPAKEKVELEKAVASIRRHEEERRINAYTTDYSEPPPYQTSIRPDQQQVYHNQRSTGNPQGLPLYQPSAPIMSDEPGPAW